MPTVRHNFPMSPDNMKSRNVALATECADVSWPSSLDGKAAIKRFQKHVVTVRALTQRLR